LVIEEVAICIVVGDESPAGLSICISGNNRKLTTLTKAAAYNTEKRIKGDFIKDNFVVGSIKVGNSILSNFRQIEGFIDTKGKEIIASATDENIVTSPTDKQIVAISANEKIMG
jgi:hypothetical protein